MPEKKFDIAAGCLGNGTTIWNRAKIKSGDYETIAHISDDGKTINFYNKRLPENIKDCIKKMASEIELTNNQKLNNMAEISAGVLTLLIYILLMYDLFTKKQSIMKTKDNKHDKEKEGLLIETKTSIQEKEDLRDDFSYDPYPFE